MWRRGSVREFRKLDLEDLEPIVVLLRIGSSFSSGVVVVVVRI